MLGTIWAICQVRPTCTSAETAASPGGGLCLAAWGGGGTLLSKYTGVMGCGATDATSLSFIYFVVKRLFVCQCCKTSWIWCLFLLIFPYFSAHCRLSRLRCHSSCMPPLGAFDSMRFLSGSGLVRMSLSSMMVYRFPCIDIFVPSCSRDCTVLFVHMCCQIAYGTGTTWEGLKMPSDSEKGIIFQVICDSNTLRHSVLFTRGNVHTIYYIYYYHSIIKYFCKKVEQFNQFLLSKRLSANRIEQTFNCCW